MEKEPKSDPEFHLDTILKQVGYLGKYQIRNLIILSVILWSGRTFDNVYMFHSAASKYRCLIENCDYVESPEYETPWLKYAVPYTGNVPENCERYIRNASAIEYCVEESFNTRQTESCKEYVFENNLRGINVDFNLFCDDNLWKLTLTGTIFNAGFLIFSYFNGYFADRFGRKKSLIAAIVAAGLFSQAKAFLAFNYPLLLLFEFLHAGASCGTFMIAFVLVTELLGPKQRVLGCCLCFSLSALGAAFLGSISLFTDNWRDLVKIASIPPILVIFYGWLAPESTRWLIATKRFDEANAQIKKMAEENGVILPESAYISEKNMPASFQPENSISFGDIFRSRKLAARVVKLCVCWMACTFVLYGITIASASVSTQFQITYIICEFLELPAEVLSYFAANHLGRQKTAIGSYFTAGLSCIMFAFLEDGWVKMGFFFLGKFAITISYTSIYIFTSELFPTAYRQRVVSLCSSFGRAASMIAPQMPLLAELISKQIPFLLFGSFAIVGGLLTLTLPETLGTRLPDTILEAERVKYNVHNRK